MILKIDFHVHTKSSPDGGMSLRDVVEEGRKKGLSGVAVCDHDIPFFAIAQPRDFLLINGCEYSTDGGHILGLFFKKCPDISPEDYVEGRVSAEKAIVEIHRAGGIAVLAHPFARNQQYPVLKSIDGIEGYNSRAEFKNKQANIQAQNLAKEKWIAQFAGSDAHVRGEVGNAYVEIELENVSMSEIKNAVLEGHSKIVGVRSKAINKGRSQWIKRKKEGKKSALVVGKLYIYYCKLKDIFGI